MPKRNKLNLPNFDKLKKAKNKVSRAPLALTTGAKLDILNVEPAPSLKPNYVCKYCNKSLSSAQTLRQHVNGHTREVLYKCTHCDKAFTRSSYLKAHTKKIHAKAERQQQRPTSDIQNLVVVQLPCTAGGNCGMSFTSQALLDAHRKEHNLPCPFCSQFATSRPLLNHHIMSHTGKLPEQCSNCNKWFMDPSVIHTHTCRPKVGNASKPMEESEDDE